jgi:LysR family transcriptional regulator, benzoate and cis,cis-muconate-responsive activator of ben and cat genes
VELRHLRYFLAVAREANFSRAAEKLHIAQSPLSRQIQQLEDELGVILLVRQRPIRLTEAGRYLYEQSRQLLERLNEVKVSTRRISRGGMARFHIGFSASTLYESLPELVRAFRAAMPDVDVSLMEMTSVEQMAALKDGRIDVGVGRVRFDDPSITREVLREEPLAAVLPRGHPLTKNRRRLKFADVASVPLVIYPKSPRPSYADRVLSLYRDRGLEPEVVCEARELQTALGLVATGVGLCIVPRSVRNVTRGELSFIEFQEPDVISPVIMCYRALDKSPWIAKFRELAFASKS